MVQMLRTKSRMGDCFVEELDAVKIAKETDMAVAPVMIYGEDVSHVVTEQGVAYLYMAESMEERRELLAAVAQGIALGGYADATKIAKFRKEGKIAYPEDLGIDISRVNKDLLAAKSLQELVDISGDLYEIPESFLNKDK